MTTEYTPSGQERDEREREAAERDDGTAAESPPRRTSGPTITEAERRARGQARIVWRTNTKLVELLEHAANERGWSVQDAITVAVEEWLGL